MTAGSRRGGHGTVGGYAAAAFATAAVAAKSFERLATSECESSQPAPEEKDVDLMNWSGTHKLTTRRLFTPESQEQLRETVAWAHQQGQKIRPIGTSLSPNGLAFAKGGMLSTTQLDKIIEVDKKNMTITTEGGCSVSTILDELRKHGMTLSNFSSITEQQIAGWTQVSAHGTGARIPTVDEMITELTIVTPGQGELKLSEAIDSQLFRLARVALGSLGVVSQVTLKCVPSYTLHEKLYTTTVDELRQNHAELLQTYRHVRYMWIPYSDTVVVVVSDVAKKGAVAKEAIPESQRVKPLRDLLRKLQPKSGPLDNDNFAQLREKLLKAGKPTDPDHVAAVNRAEAEFWRLSSGERIGDSTAILGFECGGSQWVLENCFPCGNIQKPSLKDIDYLVEIKKTIEKERIAAASPIEQRWTSASSSPLSPSYSANPDDIFSWVGVIMYITGEDTEVEVREKFKSYAMAHADQTFRYGGVFHWGKIDLAFHEGTQRLRALREQMRHRFDLVSFLAARKQLDPKCILSNELVEKTLDASR